MFNDIFKPLSLGLGVGLAVVTMLLMFASSQLETTRALLDAQKVITADLSEKLKTQNEAVQRMADAAKENREVYLAGLAAANRKAVRFEIKAEDILTLPSPATKDEQCEAARALLLETER